MIFFIALGMAVSGIAAALFICLLLCALIIGTKEIISSFFTD